MPEPIAYILKFILQTVAIFLVIRFVLQAVQADPNNQIVASVIRLTDPLLQPIRSILRPYKNIDFASFLLAWLTLTLMVILITVGQAAIFSSFSIGLYLTLDYVVWVFLFAIFATIILSFIAPGTYSPFASAAYQIAEPALAPARKILPPMAGLDFSPMITVMALYLFKNYVLPTLIN